MTALCMLKRGVNCWRASWSPRAAFCALCCTEQQRKRTSLFSGADHFRFLCSFLQLNFYFKNTSSITERMGSRAGERNDSSKDLHRWRVVDKPRSCFHQHQCQNSQQWHPSGARESAVPAHWHLALSSAELMVPLHPSVASYRQPDTAQTILSVNGEKITSLKKASKHSS